MSWPFSGIINGEVKSQPQDLPMVLTGFTIVPQTTGVVNVYKVTVASQDICIMPLNSTLNVGEMYEGTNQVVLLAAEQIKIKSSVLVHYDFKIENTEAPETT